MDALVLAAGFGSRLNSLFPSKPLAKIRGVTLLELSISQLIKAGVKRVVIATGHRAQEVENAAYAIGARLGVDIITKRVDDWSKPNGYSVIAGASAISGAYLLVMCDHILSTSILSDLASSGGEDRGVTLGIDKRVSHPLIDPEDATWVSTREDGFIRQIGKDIHGYDAVDCGAFLATPELAHGIKRAIALGRPGSLSDGMQILSDQGRAATLDIRQAWWIDVDDPHALSLAEEQIARYIDLPPEKAALEVLW